MSALTWLVVGLLLGFAAGLIVAVVVSIRGALRDDAPEYY